MPEQGRFPYKKLAKYPHLDAQDRITWEQFIDKNPEAYKSVDYDLAISDMPHVSQPAMSLGISGAERVYKYRCDVVGYTDSEIHLIEVKGRASPAVIGQVLADYELYVRDHNPQKPVKPFVICREYTPHMDFLCAQKGIYLILT